MIKEIMEQPESIQQSYNFGARILNDKIKLVKIETIDNDVFNFDKVKEYSKKVVKISDIELKKHKDFLKSEVKKNFY